jgi:large conductance mechanosensitive channel
MKGFKDFVMRGNLVELAVAFIIAGAFAKVVEAFVTVLMDLIGKAGGTPDFSSWKPGGVSLGAFITVLISFLFLAFIVYFFVVKPYEAAKSRFSKTEEDAAPDEDIVLLREIRDALTRRA